MFSHPRRLISLLKKDILQENRKTRSSKVSKFFHLSPRSKKNDQKWDLTAAFANKLKLEDPKTETFDLGSAESTDAAENTCQVAKDAPISSPEKVAQEIEEFLLRQQALSETAGATASLGEVWTPASDYKAHIAVTESLTSVDTDTEPETDLKLETTFQPLTDSDTISVNLADASNDTPETAESIKTAITDSDTVS